MHVLLSAHSSQKKVECQDHHQSVTHFIGAHGEAYLTFAQNDSTWLLAIDGNPWDKVEPACMYIEGSQSTLQNFMHLPCLSCQKCKSLSSTPPIPWAFEGLENRIATVGIHFADALG